MRTLLILVYLAAGFYSVALFVEFISHLWKNKSVSGISKVGMLNKYSVIILLVCLFVVPLELYCTIISRIPEASYTINGILEVNGDDNDYSVPVKVYYYLDIDYEEDENHDYLFDGGISTKTEVDEVFLLLDVMPPANINVPDFELEQLECLPETIQSNKTYDVDLYGWRVEGYDDWGKPIMEDGYEYGQLSIPPLTKENLGITIEDQMRSVSILGYAEHAILFIIAAACLLLLKKDNY